MRNITPSGRRDMHTARIKLAELLNRAHRKKLLMKEVKKENWKQRRARQFKMGRITETLKERGENNEEERKGAENRRRKVRNILSRVEEKTHWFCCS